MSAGGGGVEVGGRVCGVGKGEGQVGEGVRR